MQETALLDMISKENSWEEVLEYVVNEEGMDPWDIDIVKLSSAFSSYLSKVSDLDFKVPARLIIISAILIRMKVEIMMYVEPEAEKEKSPGGVPIDLSKVPNLNAPILRMPTRNVTLTELVSALDKAFRTVDNRDRRETRALEKVEEVVKTSDFNITEKINELFGRINSVLLELREGNLKFSSLVTKWTRKEVVETFLPVLHLSTDGKIAINQEDHFKEIFIKMRDSNEQESTN